MSARDPLSRLERVLAALQDGDLEPAQALIENLLADQAERAVGCDLCPMRFRLPGELDEHVRVSHPAEWLRGFE